MNLRVEGPSEGTCGCRGCQREGKVTGGREDRTRGHTLDGPEEFELLTETMGLDREDLVPCVLGPEEGRPEGLLETTAAGVRNSLSVRTEV